MENNIDQFITETVDHDAEKATLNLEENDFSSGEYAEQDGRGEEA